MINAHHHSHTSSQSGLWKLYQSDGTCRGIYARIIVSGYCQIRDINTKRMQDQIQSYCQPPLCFKNRNNLLNGLMFTCTFTRSSDSTHRFTLQCPVNTASPIWTHQNEQKRVHILWKMKQKYLYNAMLGYNKWKVTQTRSDNDGLYFVDDIINYVDINSNSTIHSSCN